MFKPELRKAFLAKRKLVASSAASLEICKKATELQHYTNAKNLMVYLPSNAEVDTSFLIAKAFKDGKTVCVPKVLNDTDMECVALHANSLKKGAFNLWESSGEVVLPDIVFVPGVAFDKKHNRLGYGKGYYDRYLDGKKCITVGLGFSCQVAESIPTEAHDRTLDYIITENEVF